jgi:flagellar biosynthesis anti-sigma factor FlgM
MKIDPRTQLPGEVQSTPVKTSRNAGAAPSFKQSTGVNPAAGEDTVRISSTHTDLQTLKANLAAVPEVRVDRVDTLQQQVNSGYYKPDSQRVADAIIADQSRRGTKA